MMKKDKRKSEYFGASKGLKLMLLMMMTAAMLLCLSACITIQVPDKSSNNNDVQTEEPKKSQSSTETPKKSSGSSATPSDSGKASGSGGSASGNSGKSGISEQEAISIALSRVKGATKSDIISFKSEYDDGRLEYEGKIKKDGVVYEFEIDGETGNILDWEIDDD